MTLHPQEILHLAGLGVLRAAQELHIRASPPFSEFNVAIQERENPTVGVPTGGQIQPLRVRCRVRTEKPILDAAFIFANESEDFGGLADLR